MSTARDFAEEVPRKKSSALDVARIRGDFPLLRQEVHGKPLIYLDSAATSQKPQVVLDALIRFYSLDNSNIHRGVHTLSQRATEAYENARLSVQRLLNAEDPREILFLRGTTEAINLVAQTFGRSRLEEGDEIILSVMEHHSNIVPWQMAAEEAGAVIRVIPINDRGELLIEEYEKLFTSRTRLVAVVHVSNALGTVNPVGEMIRTAHSHGVPVLLDGAQSVPHMKVDVRELDCDFLAFSGHKICGPTGIGVLYCKRGLLESLPPWQGGGDMISSVSFQKTTYNELPHRFEAGTPNIAGAVGLGTAVRYLQELRLDRIQAYEAELLEYATEALSAVPAVRIIGTAGEKAGVLSFVMEGVHPHDVGTILDHEGIAIRTGHHCTQPLMDRFQVPATARASFAFYNTHEEIDALAAGLNKVIEVFG